MLLPIFVTVMVDDLTGTIASWGKRQNWRVEVWSNNVNNVPAATATYFPSKQEAVAHASKIAVDVLAGGKGIDAVHLEVDGVHEGTYVVKKGAIVFLHDGATSLLPAATVPRHRVEPPRVLHSMCDYYGTCVEHQIDPSVRPCQ